MSNRERALELLEQIPDDKLFYIIGIMEGALIPDSYLDASIDESIAISEKEIEEGADLIPFDDAFAALKEKYFG
ncbi:hypothetical protein [Butyrivibrio sp. WCD2001]|uniref:hypothetical protein n=1 Tax=Butyrivibrio sp. WCD2001 TaxID=1280681 RepID=UPI000402F706|nr:hypothetical protein [Butyrivibrio sp. WCD2001]